MTKQDFTEPNKIPIMIKPVKQKSFKSRKETTQGQDLKRKKIYPGAQELKVISPRTPSRQRDNQHANQQINSKHLNVRSPKGQSPNTHICGIYYIYALNLRI